MTDRLLIAAVALLAVGCSSTSGSGDGGDPQKSYSYPGCANETAYCPNDKTYFCARDAIRNKHDSCADAGDCTATFLSGDCQGYFGCVPAVVNLREKGAFDQEALAEMTRYCANAGCNGSGSCADSYSARMVACVQGTCVAVKDDGGL